MPSLAHIIPFIYAAVFFGPATCQSLAPRPIPVCIRSDTKDAAKLEQCTNTTIFAIRAVSNASDDFEQACNSIDYNQAASQSLDLYFLRYLVCGQFAGNGVFYENSDDPIADLALASVALEIAMEDSTNPVLRRICPELNLQTLYDFGLPASLIYEAACGDVYIPSPPQFTSKTSSSASSTALSQPTSSNTTSESSTTTTAYTLSPYPTVPLTPPPSGSSTTSASSSTSCTTTSALTRRQIDTNASFDYWIKLLKSAVFALDMIESNEDDTRCDDDNFWIVVFDNLGYDGEYVELLV